MDSCMNVAIIGAGRRNNGIGEYIAKYFHAAGAEVSGVLGTTNARVSEASSRLESYGIRARAFTEFSDMIKACHPDAVVIASPTATHREYIERCFEEGYHIFCDKPFISPADPDLSGFIVDATVRAREAGVVLCMNSQWPFCLGAYEELCGRIDPARVERFSMRLSPLVKGRDMIPDSVPHALSILYCSIGPGRIEDISFTGEDDALAVSLTYHGKEATCSVSIDLVRETTQPRTFSFGFNGCIAERFIDLDTYTIHLTCRGKTLNIADPLELSVRDFLAAAERIREPLIGSGHILDTSSLLQQIYGAYSSV